MATKTKRKPRPKAKAKAKPRLLSSESTVKLQPDGLREGSDGALLVDTVCRKAGATHAELRAVVKWKACLPFLLKSAAQAKVKLRKERQGREVRYFGTASA
jgi:hypothetical protein